MAVITENELTPANQDLWKRAAAAAVSNNLDYAISLLQNLLRAEPSFVVGRRRLREIEYQKFHGKSGGMAASMKITPLVMKASGAAKKNPAEALETLEEALKSDPYNQKANELLAQVATTLNLNDVIALAYEAICEGRPDDPEPLRKLASVYVQLQEWQKGRDTYARVLKLAPNDGDSMSAMKNAMAKIASSAGGWDNKNSTFRDSLKDKDQSASLEQASKIVKSEDAIRAQIGEVDAKFRADPANLNWPKQIGALYVQLEDYETAQQWYQYAFEQGGKIDSALEKQITELRLKKVDKDIHDYRLAAEANPEEYQESLEMLVQQRKQIVLETAQQRVDRYPTEWEFYYQLGKAYVELGQYKEALQPLQQGAKSPSVRLESLNLIGYCQWQRRMLDLAEKTYVNLVHEIPTMTDLKKEVLYSLGCVLETAGKKEESIEKFKMIYEVDMTFRDVTERVEESYGEG